MAAKTPTWSFGCGLLFDGVDDLLKVPDSDSLDLAGDKMTITAWVKPNSTQIGPLVKKINPTHGYRINLTGTRALRFVLRRDGQNKTVTSTTPLPLNKWTHVAARYDGTQMRIFINGTLDTATTAATQANTPLATTAPALIGGDPNNHHFHGTLDDVSIYNRALSDTEITSLSNNRVGRYEYHHLNALGSNIVLTDDNQNMLVRYEYDVFGAIRSETGTNDNVRKFTGKEWDADVRLYYFAARYYDPYIGRFTQRDPIGDGVNWYAYTYNNPLRFIDPDGLRALNQAETNAATNFFGDMIDLEQVDIKESGVRHAIVTAITPPLTVHNDIYGKLNHTTNAKGEITKVDSTLIHELVHVWQYAHGRLDPVGGLVTHAIARATGQTAELYKYNVDHILYSERKTFREYSFEEQASIIEDAYRVLVLNDVPFYNKDRWRLSRDEWKEYYEQFMYEFQQWHQELQQSSSSSYMTHN